jgi:AcrR family transcriptional regulator
VIDHTVEEDAAHEVAQHYTGKEELFWAALEARLSQVKLSRELQSALAEQQNPTLVLSMVVDFMVRTISEQPELMRLRYVSVLELPGAASKERRAPFWSHRGCDDTQCGDIVDRHNLRWTRVLWS